ncbi:type 4a pilus biogenesis protein PilO [Cardiobacteriaceae bacterium TAE3-ERU3]|nr:type 4a pilus biogenesis protein PilO [Cardiobacteriaceae bacterium TAE3-ERU3]
MKLVKPSQLDRSNPGTWPIYYQILVWVVVAGLVWFLYNRFFREELIQTQSDNSSEIIRLQGDYRTLYQFSLDLPLYKDKKNELTDKLYSLLEFLPAETEMPNLIDETYKAAYESEINFSEFKPETSIVKQYYDIEPISLSTNTNFVNFAHFVESIGELPRILNVRRFDIGIASQNVDQLKISSDLETYIYNQDISKLVGETEGGKR